jgi:cation diffusion facilitator family transporter
MPENAAKSEHKQPGDHNHDHMEIHERSRSAGHDDGSVHDSARPHPNDHPHPHGSDHLGHDHDHPHPHQHSHEEGHFHGDGADHHHEQPKNVFEWVLAALHLGKFAHDHDHGISGSIVLTSERGIWAIKISFTGLMITAVMQVIIVYFSGSVALLADTIHNFGDAATAIPLWIAFSLSRRPRTRRYNYGYNRAEDLAGVVVIGLILLSAIVAGYEAINRFFNPRVVEYVGWVAAAAVIGFLGNEAVAIFRIRVGREIGSAALIADGLHARIDGLTSLAVLVGAMGVWAGFPLADPIIGLIITAAILRITWNATKFMWYRMMDAVEPEIVDMVENTALAIEGVQDVHDIRCRWVGHQLHASIHIQVDAQTNVAAGHQISEEVRHALFHALPRLTDAVVHMDPAGPDQLGFHQSTLHHMEVTPASEPTKTKEA